MNSYINLLPVGQTPCPNPLPFVSSSSQQHRVLPLSSPSSPNHEDIASRGTICYLPPSTAPKMKIIDSVNGGFLQPSLFLKAFERVLDSQVCFKSSRVFFCRGISDFSEKSRLVVGLFAENLLNFFPRVNSKYRSTHLSPTNSGRV